MVGELNGKSTMQEFAASVGDQVAEFTVNNLGDLFPPDADPEMQNVAVPGTQLVVTRHAGFFSPRFDSEPLTTNVMAATTEGRAPIPLLSLTQYSRDPLQAPFVTGVRVFSGRSQNRERAGAFAVLLREYSYPVAIKIADTAMLRGMADLSFAGGSSHMSTQMLNELTPFDERRLELVLEGIGRILGVISDLRRGEPVREIVNEGRLPDLHLAA